MELKLSQPELEVMEEFRKQGRLSIREIQESFSQTNSPPYTSIQTILPELPAFATAHRNASRSV